GRRARQAPPRLCLTRAVWLQSAGAAPRADRLSGMRRAARAQAWGALPVLRHRSRGTCPGGPQPRRAHGEGSGRRRDRARARRVLADRWPRADRGGRDVRSCGSDHVLPGSQDLLMPASTPRRTTALPTWRALRGGARAARADLMLVPVSEDRVAAAVKPLGRPLAATLERRSRAAEFRAVPGELLIHQGDRGSVALAGLGTDPGPETWLRTGARARREAERLGARRVAIYLGARAVSDEGVGRPA